MILHFTYWKKSGVKFNEKTITGEGGGGEEIWRNQSSKAQMAEELPKGGRML